MRRTEVVVPAQPAAVTGVKVHGYVGEVELLQCVCDALTVTGGGSLASCKIGIGDKVGKRVRLDDERDGNLGVLFDDGNDGLVCQRQV